MRRQTVGLIAALIAGNFLAMPAFAGPKRDDGRCIAFGNDSSAAPDAASCQGGPLKPGDPRLGNAKVPRTADRETPPKHSFDVGGTSVTVSGSIRVDSVYAK